MSVYCVCLWLFIVEVVVGVLECSYCSVRVEWLSYPQHALYELKDFWLIIHLVDALPVTICLASSSVQVLYGLGDGLATVEIVMRYEVSFKRKLWLRLLLFGSVG